MRQQNVTVSQFLGLSGTMTLPLNETWDDILSRCHGRSIRFTAIDTLIALSFGRICVDGMDNYPFDDGFFNGAATIPFMDQLMKTLPVYFVSIFMEASRTNMDEI
jgi:hypothetical protein